MIVTLDPNKRRILIALSLEESQAIAQFGTYGMTEFSRRAKGFATFKTFSMELGHQLYVIDECGWIPEPDANLCKGISAVEEAFFARAEAEEREERDARRAAAGEIGICTACAARYNLRAFDWDCPSCDQEMGTLDDGT